MTWGYLKTTLAHISDKVTIRVHPPIHLPTFALDVSAPIFAMQTTFCTGLFPLFLTRIYCMTPLVFGRTGSQVKGTKFIDPKKGKDEIKAALDAVAKEVEDAFAAIADV